MPQPTAAHRQRLLLWGLVASLTANLFLAGLTIGYAATQMPFGDDDRRGRTGLGIELRGYADSLPAEEQEALRERLREVIPQMQRPRERLRALRAEIAALVVEPQPDRAAIDARLAEIRAVSTEMQELVQRHAFDALLDLPPEVRRELRLSGDAPRAAR